jgi:hypothetical protein
MADDPTLTPGREKFDKAVAAFSAHLGKCTVYRNMGVMVATWDVGGVTVQLTDEDDVYLHYHLDVDAMARGGSPGISQEMASMLLEYAGQNGIPMGSAAPPPPKK